MRLTKLREDVLAANLELVRRGLVLYTFGNASGISRRDGLVVIKPSGVPYEELAPDCMVITNLEGEIVEGDLRPSSDLATHLEIYRHFQEVGGVVHTHSEFATAWAQARRPIPCLGTTHADYFHSEVPVTSFLTSSEVQADYEKNTGLLICKLVERFGPNAVPAVLVAGHGPFCWGPNVAAAVHNAVILEAVARMAYYTVALARDVEAIPGELHDRHFLRKHGQSAYYGQVKTK
jgi:L-ribulose-5-phosphate 4-epimerase